MTTAAVAGRLDTAAWLPAAERRVFRLERWLCSAALAVMLLTVAASVVVRYFDLRIPNVAEWAIVAMSPLTFVGAAMCTYLQAHIAVDVIKLVRSPALQRAVRAVVAIAVLAFAGVYAWIGWTLFAESVQSGERLLDMGTPVAVPVGFLVLGMGLMVLHGAMELWRVFTGRPAIREEDLQ